MGDIERRPKLRVLRCPECGELHLDSSEECSLECGSAMEEVEVVAADQLAGAVEDNEGLLNMLRELHAVALTDGYGETVAERAAALIDRFESR